MTPAIHTMTASVYHSDPCPAPSLSNGIIKLLLAKSPAHAHRAHPKLGGVREVHNGTFDYGTAAHAILLEPNQQIILVDADDWRTKDAKAERDAAREAGVPVMLRRQFEEASERAEIARQYLRNSVLGNILADGLAEQSVLWQQGGIWCRARPDWLTTDRSIILDYKTTSVSNPATFCRSCMHQFGYDTQSVFYRMGVRSLTGVDAEFVFLVQEDEAPYSCYLVQCAPSMEEVASHKVKRAMAIWLDCLATGQWPGYEETIYHAEASAWAITEEEVAS